MPRVLAIGAQSSLTGGATPRGDLLLSTRHLRSIDLLSASAVRVGAGVPLADLQRALAARGLYYPPVPTFDGACTGGTVATNAAGAATFKYGTTRAWVQALEVVLADGSIVHLRRGDALAADGAFEFELAGGRVARVDVPTYRMPDVPKLSAGYFAAPGMDVVDLFVGSEGTLGVIVAATLGVVPLPRQAVVLIVCESDEQAVALTLALRGAATACWRGEGPLDVAAIEYVDRRAVGMIPADVLARAGLAHVQHAGALLLVQLELAADGAAALLHLDTLCRESGVTRDPEIAMPGDDRGIARLLHVREAVPSAVNARVAAAQAAVHPEIQKTAGDLIVPVDRLGDSIALYRRCFEDRDLDYALWGHASDGNLHPNVVPRSLDDVERGREAILEMADGVMAMGGAPLAEHGVGRSPLKQRLLQALYGSQGIDEMRAVKRALDPEWRLAPGVLFPEPG